MGIKLPKGERVGFFFFFSGGGGLGGPSRLVWVGFLVFVVGSTSSCLS